MARNVSDASKEFARLEDRVDQLAATFEKFIKSQKKNQKAILY